MTEQPKDLAETLANTPAPSVATAQACTVPPIPDTAGQRLVTFLIEEYRLAKTSPLTTRIGAALLFVTVFKIVGPEEMKVWTDALAIGVSIAASIGLVQAKDR